MNITLKEVEEMGKAHLRRIDQQIFDQIKQRLNNKLISQDQFVIDPKTGHEFITIKVDDGNIVIYDYTTKRVHKYGDNFNVNVY